ncbi:MAG: MBL fold metallo-hydrolase [Parachlamydiales bacterium]|jgi:glyoxylase-like metal-dependent hydrolase (beta-lactamase superfamily II)
MFIFPLVCPPIDTNAYVIGCKVTKHAAIIDPGMGSFEFTRTFLEKQGYTLKMVLCTHSHWDHIAEAARFQEECGVPIYVHKEDAFNLIHPGQDGLPFPFPIQECTPNHLMNDGDQISLGELTLQVIHTPGHSRGGVCFYFPNENVLFSGDTLFKGTMGKVSFPTSDPMKMKGSLIRLSQLPKITRVYPGHGPETTIGQETWINKL